MIRWAGKSARRWAENCVLIFAVLVIGVYVWDTFVHRPQDALCKTLIRLVERSNTTLPTITYYKQHPDELNLARRLNNQNLHDLKNACP